MCDDITCGDLYLARAAGMDDITCDDVTHEYLNPECQIMGLGLIILCVTILRVVIYILTAWLGWMI